MAYSTAADIQRLIHWMTFTTASVPLTTGDLAVLIQEQDALIDGVIGQLYAVPVTHATDVVILRYASARLAAHETAKVLAAQAGGELPKIVETWKTDAEERLERIRTRGILLENTPSRRVAADGLYSHAAHDTDAPKREWELGKDQW